MAVQIRIPPDLSKRALLRMAEAAVQQVRRRAFPTGGRAGTGVAGDRFEALSPAYKKRKVEKGRPGVPDQRFTSSTANALGVTGRSAQRVSIGFRERRVIAEALEQRNRYWGLSAKERAAVQAIAERAGAEFARSVRITGGIEVGRPT